MASSSLSPTWTINNGNNSNNNDANSNHSDSLHVMIPPGSSIQCPSSSSIVVSYDVDILRMETKKVLRGNTTHHDIYNNNHNTNAAAPPLVTPSQQYSFWKRNNHRHDVTTEMTMIENTSGNYGSVSLSTSKQLPCCAIAMHLMDDDYDISSLWISTNAYLASDASIQIMEPPNKDDGMMKLCISPKSGGYVAIAGLGGVQKYTLQAGQSKSIAAGHLVACSGSMDYNQKLVTTDNSTRNSNRRQPSSSTSSQQYHRIQGPGVVYVQTHAPHELLLLSSSSSSFGSIHRPKANNAGRTLFKIIILLCFCVVLEIFSVAINLELDRRAAEAQYKQLGDSSKLSEKEQRRQQRRQRQNKRNREYGGNLALGSTEYEYTNNDQDAQQQQQPQDPWQDDEL